MRNPIFPPSSNSTSFIVRHIMQLTKNLFVLNVACGALAQISTHPPGGAGTITVSISGTEVDGCLHANGQWNVAGDCPIFGGNGVGGLASNDGYLDVTKESVIVPSVGSFDTAWVGYFIDSTVSRVPKRFDLMLSIFELI